MNVGAGAALPVKALALQPPQGNVARPVHTYHTQPDAGVQGAPVAQPVVYVLASQLVQNGGTFYLSGDPVALPVYDGHTLNVGAGAPLAVYEA